MSFDYSEFRALATGLITEFGVTETFTRKAKSDDGPDPTITETTFTAKLVRFDQEYFDQESRTVVNMEVLYIEAGKTAPMVNDRVTLGSVTYRLDSIKPIAPTGYVTVYEAKVSTV